MRFNVFKNTVLLFVLVLISCGNKLKSDDQILKEEIPLKNKMFQHNQNDTSIVVGANRTEIYLPKLNDKRVGIVANQTSVIFKKDGYTHLVDSLMDLNVNIKKVFAPEHGFRGTADAGELVKDGIDTKSGLPIVSLYGKNKKPSLEQLKGLDIVIFDIQDVGVRFYTYISSLHYVMEACAEAGIPVMILDRPNPNGHYIDGPILEIEHRSFIGMHTVPVVHGVTIGEGGLMINGEKWLNNKIQCELIVIEMENYTHQTRYELPIKPSPNLPNAKSINLYPSLCFFEGTNVSAGRGTDKQFQIYGSPYLPESDFSFTPQSNPGAKYPKHEGKICFGDDLSQTKSLNALNLDYLIDAYNTTEDQSEFFIPFFTKLAGTKILQKQIESGLNSKQIKASWTKGLEAYNEIRKVYLIYK